MSNERGKVIHVLNQSIAVVNAKGGVGKTSVAANLAGSAAAAGWKVLAIDLDRQGHLALEFGVRAKSDNGAGLHRAIRDHSPMERPSVIEARPGLDVVTAGEETDELGVTLMVLHQQRKLTGSELAEAIEGLAPNYDLIVIDCPPTVGEHMRLALSSAHFMVIPTRSDVGSLEGVEAMAAQYAQYGNPDLRLLGVVLFDIDQGPRMSEAPEARAALTPYGINVFPTSIRSAKTASRQARERGELAIEYADQVTARQAEHKRERFRFLRERKKNPDASAPASLSVATNAGEFANDYRTLTAEVLAAYTKAQEL
jgi:chromosome partitioning protein